MSTRGENTPIIGPPASKKISLRAQRLVHRVPKVLAIGSSTGGPEVLIKLFKYLAGKQWNVPIFITQHMPEAFTKSLASTLSRVSMLPCEEAAHEESVRPGRIYLAPGDYHMLVTTGEKTPIIQLSKGPPENFCRPAVDPMLRSIARVYESDVLAAILTGMGNDGLKGCGAVVEHGGEVIAQDEASSVVWGMPKAVAEAGLCTMVAPVEQLAAYILDRFRIGGMYGSV